VVSFDRSRSKLFAVRFSNKSVRDRKLLSEACFCNLKSIIVFPNTSVIEKKLLFQIIEKGNVEQF
jgi:hypothetical protein